ncbi:MAG: hypothetical protein ACXVX5_01000 [Mycobacterium sp.]
MPPSGQWMPPYAPQPVARPFAWPAIALSAIATVAAVAALVVALTKPTASVPAMAPGAPTYTAAEAAVAQRELCETYKLAARAIAVDTAGTDRALARIADTNGAVMLEMAAANPALDSQHRDAARALAAAYAAVTAKGNSVVANDAEYRAALADVIAKDAVMKRVCGGS